MRNIENISIETSICRSDHQQRGCFLENRGSALTLFRMLIAISSWVSTMEVLPFPRPVAKTYVVSLGCMYAEC